MNPRILVLVAALARSHPAPAGEPPAMADGLHRPDIIGVTFREGVHARLRQGQPSDLGSGDLAQDAPLFARLKDAGCLWERAYPDVTEERLEEMRKAAAAYWGGSAPDLNLQFNLRLGPGVDAGAVCKDLEALGVVRRAEPFLLGGDDPTPPNFRTNQTYFNASPVGINTSDVSGWPGGTGMGVTVADCERQWNTLHADLPAMTRAGPPSLGDPATSSNDHGTAVIGVLLARSNTWGTTGSVPDAAGVYAHVYTNNTYDVAAAIVNASALLGPGSVLMVEQQMVGPTGAVIAMEWRLDVYNAIRAAVGNGITVCEAAGNGSQNYDAATYSTGNGGHYPFLPQNDSGAIIVGAGAAGVGGSTVARSRLDYSNYGQTVDLQGWGERVFTLAYGDAYSSEGTNYYYTATFNGTSSATPVVTSACALLQGVYRATTGRWLTPAQVRQYLRDTGSPQTSGAFPASQNIGPLPNVRAAVFAALGGTDCNANGRPDLIDIRLGASRDRNANGVPDECETTCPADLDDGTGTGSIDFAVTVDDLLIFLAWYAAGDARADLDNGSAGGVHDGAVTIEDLTYFVSHYAQGC